MQKITPFLWFNNNAEEAINFYKTVFSDVKVSAEARYPEGSPAPAGSLMSATITIMGQDLMLLNGGPEFQFTEAFSLFVSCDNQAEVDDLWSKLTADGGQESQCGWLKDKFGLSWQIVPKALGELLGDADPARAGRVMQAMLQMRKIDIPTLEAAYRG